MKLFYISFTILSFLFVYGLGFTSGIMKIFPYEIVKKIKGNFNNKTKEKSIKNLVSCELQEINNLPKSFSVVIGHAYGSPKKATVNDFLAKNVEKFLEKNKGSIQNIIFTGDVFRVPSSLKWKKLYKEFNSANIYIAPGNHDIFRPDAKEIFLKNTYIKKQYPIRLSVEDISILIDDSVSSNWNVNENLKTLINNLPGKSIFIARHNIHVSELMPFANSLTGNPKLQKVKNFRHEFDKDKDITWIMGDGGAFPSKPRLTCYKYYNHRFIVNGIGDLKGDIVLILYNGEVYSYVI